MVHRIFHTFLTLLVCCISVSSIHASISTPVEEGGSASAETPESPWLVTPLINSAPKFDTSIGTMGAYLHKFDENSPTSILGAIVSYSNTESFVYGGSGATYFDNDNR